jgi:hypothetical protein
MRIVRFPSSELAKIGRPIGVESRYPMARCSGDGECEPNLGVH